MEKSLKDPFRLSVAELPPQRWLHYSHSGVLIGSCFANEIGERLAEDGFPVLVNPYGTLFNPVSIFNSISLTENQVLEAIVERDDGYASLLLHSDIWAENRDELLPVFATKKKLFEEALDKADWISLTFGTAWVYERISDGVLCANLHKRPASEFRQRLLSVEEILGQWQIFSAQLSKFSKKRIYLTVSPVIHGRNGLAENSLSKSVLRVAANEIVRYGAAAYFPSLEIIRDELRDYRFYAEDMQHPSQQATDIVYDRFLKILAEGETLKLIPIIRLLRTRILHRPRANSDRYFSDVQASIEGASIPENVRAILISLLENTRTKP